MVRRHSARLIGLSVTICLMLTACNYEYNQMRGTLKKQVLLPHNEIPLEKVSSFSQVQQSVFLVRCQNCHQASGAFTFEDYKTVKSMLAKVENRVFSIADMPPGRPLSDEQKNLLLDWIEDGAPP